MLTEELKLYIRDMEVFKHISKYIELTLNNLKNENKDFGTNLNIYDSYDYLTSDYKQELQLLINSLKELYEKECVRIVSIGAINNLNRELYNACILDIEQTKEDLNLLLGLRKELKEYAMSFVNSKKLNKHKLDNYKEKLDKITGR